MDTRILAIVGPTGSGKSEVAVALCDSDGEIISCDSVQIYRGFELGCAKPRTLERERVRHHLIDVANWNEPFDAARFRQLATAAVSDIAARGRRPILCGGTGLYLRVLRWGLVDAPASDPALRERLFARENAEPGSLFADLTRVDPVTALRTEPHNLVHIVRALEIFMLTGLPASDFRARHGFREEQLPMRVVALRWPRDMLRQRIRDRCENMIRGGLVDEVRRLLSQGVSERARPMLSVGYRETCDVVIGRQNLEGLAERIAASTWAYARRQMTWLRRERDVSWLDITSTEQAVRILGSNDGADRCAQNA